MKKYWICIFAAAFLFGCDKINLSKNSKKKIDNNGIIAAQLSKITNKFNIVEINSEKIFSLLVNKRAKPCAVLFYSNESAPCIHTKRFFADMSQNSSNDVLFIQVNLSDEIIKRIGVKYNVFSVPSLVLFNNGEEFNRLVGQKNVETFNSFIIK